MCGIAGLARLDGGLVDAVALGRMLDLLAHRGPDGGGFLVDTGSELRVSSHRPTRQRAILRPPRTGDGGPTLALGHRRLAITDLTPAGFQPMSWGDGRFWISYNGALYNAPELRSELAREGARFQSTTDTEVLLAALACWGEAALSRFNGMWAFALWDTALRELFCARDRFGIKNLVYTWKGDLLAFASEPKALRVVAPATADPAAVQRFLTLGIVCGEGESAFEGVSSVPAGGFLRASRGGITVGRWYELDTAVQGRAPPSSFARSCDELGGLLRSAVTLCLRADVHVGACLSGGLDSSALVALASRAAPHPLRAIATRYPDRPDIDESAYASEVARATGCVVRFVEPTEEAFDRELDDHVAQLDDLFPHSGSFAQRTVYCEARATGLPVMLSGQGADELFGGYEPWAVYLSELRREGRNARAVVEGFLSGKRQRGFRGGARRAAGELVRSARETFARTSVVPRATIPLWLGARVRDQTEEAQVFAAPASLRDYLTEMLLRAHLPALLRFEDRNAMAFGVEARLPFLDHRIVELAHTLPADHLLRNGATKAVLREAVRGLIPESVRVRRVKLGFPGPIEASTDARAAVVLAAWARLAEGAWVRGAFPLPPASPAGRALGLRARVLDSFTRRCLGAAAPTQPE